ncbi:MAG: hypothetical protein Q9183_003074 [Haloplaca sp. 2 TL-2023]
MNTGIGLGDASTAGYESDAEINESHHQVIWANVMAEGNYANPSIYHKVEVLMLFWKATDMDTENEVNDLQAVFERDFGFNVTLTQLDAKLEKCLQVQINAVVASWVYEHSGLNTLLIVYYAGHGKPGEFYGSLELMGQVSPNDHRSKRQRDRNRVVWNKTEDLLRPAEADVLEIFDWSVVTRRTDIATDRMDLVVTRVPWDLLEARTGGMATSRKTTMLIACRLFEYLAATKDHGTTTLPGPTSFTSALIFALKELKREKPEGRFTTTDLFRKIRDEAPDFPKDQVPAISEREHKNTAPGRIMLGPLRQEQQKCRPVDQDSTLREATKHTVTLRFDFGEKPTDDHLRTLGRAFNDIFERHTLGILRVRWAGMRVAPFLRAARFFRRGLHRRRASDIGSSSSEVRRLAIDPSYPDRRLDTNFLSPQSAMFDPRDCSGDVTSSPLTVSSPATSNNGDEVVVVNMKESSNLQESRDSLEVSRQEEVKASWRVWSDQSNLPSG